MSKKKDKLIDKIVKKNYNNELEQVLENKDFDEYTKNILLNILYKLDTAYKDYEQVKRNVMAKDEYMQRIIDVIKNDVDTIKIVKMNSKDAEILEKNTFLVDKKTRTIICYPIERNVLYSLAKISKKDKIIKDKYSVIDKTISDLLLVGNNINTVEPLRDFNGFSWSTIAKEIESLEYNLIYQNLRIITGAEFLNNWIYNKEFIIDYFELFESKIEEYYGQKNQKDLINVMGNLSVLLETKYNKDRTSKLQKSKKEVEQKLAEISDKDEFTKEITKEKKDLNKKIKKIDTILNDKKLLKNEYEKRNELLPLDKKIFSMRIFSNILKQERQELCKKIENLNSMLNPQKFMKYENKLEEKYKYLKILNTEDVGKEIEKDIIEFQKIFLECYCIKIKKANTGEDLVNLLVEFRYYLNLPYNRTKKIGQVKSLSRKINQVSEMLINKAIQEKVIINISNNEEINYCVYKDMLNSRIINLERINIKATKEDGRLYLQMFDENIFEEKLDLGDLNTIDLNEFLIKFNKNVKLFNN